MSERIDVPTDGGPVSSLAIFDRTSPVTLPVDMNMGDGRYQLDHIDVAGRRQPIYRWKTALDLALALSVLAAIGWWAWAVEPVTSCTPLAGCQ